MSSWFDPLIVSYFYEFVLFLSWIIILVNGILCFAYIVQLGLAGIGLRHRRSLNHEPLAVISPEKSTKQPRKDASSLPSISILMPAYNESQTIIESVYSVLGVHYPSIEIIIINDGSTDDMLSCLVAAFQLEKSEDTVEKAALPHNALRGVYRSRQYPNLKLLDKKRGGKADALNAGICMASHALITAIDADSLLEPSSLFNAVQPFMDDPERMVAVGGTVRLANGCRINHGKITEFTLSRSPLIWLQVIEYLRISLMGRLSWSVIKALPLISGSFGMFRRSEVIKVGGYMRNTVGEDFELIVRLHRRLLDAQRAYRIEFIPETVCWTQAPGNMRSLMRQRIRWQRGALETFFRHIGMLFRPRYGRVGTISLGYSLLVDILGPFSELIGYLLAIYFWNLGLLSTKMLVVILVLVFLYNMLISIGALIMNERKFHQIKTLRNGLILVFTIFIENFGFRQILNFARIMGWWSFLTNRSGSGVWQQIERVRFEQQSIAREVCSKKA